MQVANSLLPLVTVPYIVRVIGPDFYGLISFAQAYVMYFTLVVNYGFDLSASRSIARIREDAQEVRRVFWSVIGAKCALFVLSTVVFGITLIYVPKFSTAARVLISSYLILFGWVLFPTWFFQGLERLGVLAALNFAVKLIFTLSVFVFLHHRNDFLLVPLLMSGGQVVIGVVALWKAQRILGGIEIPTFRNILFFLREGWTVFLSTVFINFYTLTNTVMLGFFASNERLGYFAAGSRLVSALQSIIIYPLSQSFYPHISHLMSVDMREATVYLKKLTAYVLVLTLPVAVILYVFAPSIVALLFGRQFIPAVKVVRILSPLIVIVGLGTVFGVQGILNMREDSKFLRIIMMGAFTCIILNLILSRGGDESGTSIAWLLTESLVTLSFLQALRSRGIHVMDPAFYRSWLFRR